MDAARQRVRENVRHSTAGMGAARAKSRITQSYCCPNGRIEEAPCWGLPWRYWECGLWACGASVPVQPFSWSRPIVQSGHPLPAVLSGASRRAGHRFLSPNQGPLAPHPFWPPDMIVSIGIIWRQIKRQEHLGSKIFVSVLFLTLAIFRADPLFNRHA
jgi:hypothetical protein